MAPPHLQSHRLHRILLSIGLVVLTLGLMTPLATIAARATPEPSSRPRDLAAIALKPLDLNTLGLQPYGIGDSRYLTIDDTANLIAEIQEQSLTETARVLNSAHLARGYTLTNDNLTPPGDPGSGLNGFVQSTILEFPSTPAATAAYDSLTTWPSTSGVAINASEPSLGDASQLVAYTTGGGESPAQQVIQLTFRSNNLVAWIIFSARTAPNDAPALMASLGQLLLEKMSLAMRQA